MKKNIVELILLVFILTTSCYVLILLLEQKENNDSKKIELMQMEKLDFDLYFRQSIYEMFVNNEMIIVNKPAVTKINSFVTNKGPLLVYRYSAFNCNECVEFGHNKLKEYFPDYKSNPNLLLMISNFPTKDTISYNKVLNLDKVHLGLPIEAENHPFYFVLNEGRVHHVFVPDKNFSEFTDLYLETIKKRYFDY